MQADWRSTKCSWTYGQAPNAIDISYGSLVTCPSKHRHGANHFIRWFRHTAPISRLLRHAGDKEDTFSTYLQLWLLYVFSLALSSISLSPLSVCSIALLHIYLSKCLSYHFVKSDNFMRCGLNFLIFYTMIFMILTHTLHAKRQQTCLESLNWNEFCINRKMRACAKRQWN